MNLNQWEVINELTTQYSTPKIIDGKFTFIRDKMSASVYFFKSGQTKSIHYYNHMGHHRDPQEGPAAEGFYANGKLSYRQYCWNGAFHRPLQEGPAYESLYLSGGVWLSEYWEHGEKKLPLLQMVPFLGKNQ
jgi:hypothetical protein